MDRRKRTARTVALMSLFSMTDTQENVPVASFDGDGSDLISLIVGIDPVQAGSGDPSPDNVRPISGWTGANIHVSQTTDAADGKTYTITFPTSAGNVYGGTLDVTKGKLTVDRAILTCNGREGWIAAAGAINRFTYINPTLGASSNYSTFTSNYLKTSEWGVSLFTFAVRTSGNVFVMLDGNAPQMTADDFKAYLVSNPLQICYEIATPIVYDLTPTEINTLIGTNNIWADTGEIKYIEYNV